MKIPPRITFSDKIINDSMEVNTEYLVGPSDNSKTILIKKYIYKLSFYERDSNLFTGKISDILQDIFKLHDLKVSKVYYSKQIESYSNNILFNINSNIKWASYVFLFQIESISNKGDNIEISEDTRKVLTDNGFNFSLEPNFENNIFVILPLPYIRFVENKIINPNTDKESLLIVLERNKFRWPLITDRKIELKVILKNTKNDEIYNEEITIEDNDNKRFIFYTISPSQSSPIGWSEVKVFISGTMVDFQSGYYIRNIKVNFKVNGEDAR